MNTSSKLQLSDEEKQSDWEALEQVSEDSVEEIEKDIESFRSMGHRCGQWLLENLLITEKDRKGDALTNLVADKLTHDRSGWKRDEHTILSYNIGATLQLLCLLHQESAIKPSSPASASLAESCHVLAAASITPYKAIFNTSAPNPAERIWSDFPYFTHLLIEGLLAYTATFPQHPKKKEIENMILHNVEYTKEHLSKSDNALFYHRNLRLCRISAGKAEEWNAIMGVNEHGEVDKTERVFDEPFLEVGEREMARTLLAQAGVARGFALVGDRLGRKRAVEGETRRVLGSASLVAGDW
ncbi:hypothetical protein ABW19_dt0203749 [Dactylella cylindrospora]|nr:hypothetical protein ABW19_dt0203749 [Dactylella cylindrospora]